MIKFIGITGLDRSWSCNKGKKIW